jgi:hypothetical protein
MDAEESESYILLQIANYTINISVSGNVIPKHYFLHINKLNVRCSGERSCYKRLVIPESSVIPTFVHVLRPPAVWKRGVQKSCQLKQLYSQ